ncbi:hypothetical protein [Alkalihalobacillus sp. R86527]|uniref:hypothetical protein n=1 Tax=Alkalihalobacillus sp. R86527 TaxID=3093863 RepID=UPI00366C8D6A
MKQVSEQKAIPKLELEEFRFSPPGSMGWSYAEYEKIIDSGQQALEVDTNSSLTSPPIPSTTLKELPHGDGTIIDIPNVTVGVEEPNPVPGEHLEGASELVEVEEFVNKPSVDAKETSVEGVELEMGGRNEEYSLIVKEIGRPRNLGKSRFRCAVLNQDNFFNENCGCEQPILMEVAEEGEMEETEEEVIVICEDEDAPELDIEDNDEEVDCEDDDDEDEDEDELDWDGKVRIIDIPMKRSSLWVPA